MTRRAQSLHEHLSAYQAMWDRANGGQMDQKEVEGWLRVGMSLYDMIRAMDEQWSQAVREGKLDQNGAEGEELRQLYADWLRPAEVAMKKLTELRRQGLSVNGEEEFQRAWALVKLAFQIGEQEKAAKARPPGERRMWTLQEVRDELRAGHGRGREGRAEAPEQP